MIAFGTVTGLLFSDIKFDYNGYYNLTGMIFFSVNSDSK